jgi:hypothetical protein
MERHHHFLFQHLCHMEAMDLVEHNRVLSNHNQPYRAIFAEQCHLFLRRTCHMAATGLLELNCVCPLLISSSLGCHLHMPFTQTTSSFLLLTQGIQRWNSMLMLSWEALHRQFHREVPYGTPWIQIQFTKQCCHQHRAHFQRTRCHLVDIQSRW